MKQYLAIYLASPAGAGRAAWDKLSEAERKQRQVAGFDAWGEWIRRHQASIVELGGPLGKTKQVGPDGVADVRNAMTAYTLVKAESHEAAAKLFEGHPHFALFPGDSIEIMECLPVPTERPA